MRKKLRDKSRANKKINNKNNKIYCSKQELVL